MRKWLAALFCCLVMLSAAQAEEDLFAALSGLWRWEPSSPSTALGDGVYFHVDGSCALYDASAYDEYHTDLITGWQLREEGRWSVEGDILVVTTADAVYTFPVEVMAWPDWEYHDGLRIGGGAYLPGNGVPLEESIPDDILHNIYAWHARAELIDYGELPDVGGEPMAFVLLKTENGRELWMYGMDDRGCWWQQDTCIAAIPQIDLPYVGLVLSKGGGSYEEDGSLWYDADKHDYPYPGGSKVGVWTGNGETIEERVEFVWEEDGFYLHHYGYSPGNMIDLAGEDLIFYNIGSGYEGRAYCPFDCSLYAIDFYTLPRRIADVRITGGDEPPLPNPIRPAIMDKQPFLTQQEVTLKKGKYPVYIGPGKGYGRAANGKALVSTGGWVQVFGEYDGWLLIHYAVNAEQYRFGWITADALAKGQKAPALPLVFGDYTTADRWEPLTDDPLNSHNTLITIPEGAAIEYLAQVGEGYSYVRVVVDGKTWWGFISSWPLGHGGVFDPFMRVGGEPPQAARVGS